MIQTENIEIRGKVFVRTWSDAGKMIERDGALYEEAIDPPEMLRVYFETEQDIEVETPEEESA